MRLVSLLFSCIVFFSMFVLHSFKSSSRFKLFVTWAIRGAIVFFIAQTLRDNWPAVTEINLTALNPWGLVIAGVLSLVAHCWAGWVWHWLLQALHIPLSGLWAMRVYLFTNVAKYLPGNIWHFYGRVRVVQDADSTLGESLASVIAEPLVMAVAAVGLGAIASLLSTLVKFSEPANRLGSGPLWTLGLFAGWIVDLLLLHPRWLNPRLAQMSRVKLKGLSRQQSAQTIDLSAEDTSQSTWVPAKPLEPALTLDRYPLRPLLGEMGFVLGRSLGFIATITAFAPISLTDWPLIIASFSIAWVLGLVIPGAPGGIGVFEVSVIMLLGGQLPQVFVLGSVACYRLVSTLAEAIGAAAVWLLGGLPKAERP